VLDVRVTYISLYIVISVHVLGERSKPTNGRRVQAINLNQSASCCQRKRSTRSDSCT